MDAIFSDQPNALIIITGDFNPNSTGLQSKEIAQPNQLKQLVKFKTRDSGILVWMFVNKPKMFDLTRLTKIGTSDHYSILAKPKPKSETKSVIKKIKIRDTRDSAWRALGRWIVEKEWSSILNAPSCEDKYDSFMCEINCAIDTFLRLQTIKKHPTDRPWITKKINNCIYKRQSAFTRHGKDSLSFMFWRNKVQREIKMAKHRYYNNRVSKLENTSSSKWWREIKRRSGQDIKHEWHHQLLPPPPSPKKMDSDFRPISLTGTFTITKLLPELDNKIDVRQYARKGHSTTDALLYLLQAIFEAMDRGNTAARIFFADFSKGFDLIDHNFLLHELEKLSVSSVLIRWIAAFLTNRQQGRLHMRNSLTHFIGPAGLKNVN